MIKKLIFCFVFLVIAVRAEDTILKINNKDRTIGFEQKITIKVLKNEIEKAIIDDELERRGISISKEEFLNEKRKEYEEHMFDAKAYELMRTKELAVIDIARKYNKKLITKEVAFEKVKDILGISAKGIDDKVFDGMLKRYQNEELIKKQESFMPSDYSAFVEMQSILGSKKIKEDKLIKIFEKDIVVTEKEISKEMELLYPKIKEVTLMCVLSNDKGIFNDLNMQKIRETKNINEIIKNITGIEVIFSGFDSINEIEKYFNSSSLTAGMISDIIYENLPWIKNKENYYSVLKVLSVERENTKGSYAEAKERIKNQLKVKKAKRVFDTWMVKQIKEVKVEVLDEKYKKMVNGLLEKIQKNK